MQSCALTDLLFVGDTTVTTGTHTAARKNASEMFIRETAPRMTPNISRDTHFCTSVLGPPQPPPFCSAFLLGLSFQTES